MIQAQLFQEYVHFGEDGRLCGVLHYATGPQPLFAALLCSPHPNFAGDMENNVIAALAGGLSERAVVLRFDYRGIGQSRIELPEGVSPFDYWDQIEQSGDFSDPLEDTADAATELARIAGSLPMIAIGYSFGALMAARIGLADPRFAAIAAIAPPLTRVGFDFLAGSSRPCLIVSGEEDFVFDPGAAARIEAAGGRNVTLERVADQDHFFRGHEPEVVQRIGRFAAHHALGPQVLEKSQ